jgi:hypothetical protein
LSFLHCLLLTHLCHVPFILLLSLSLNPGFIF